ncbi:MAG: hypothetical protein R8J84_02240 [Mariprofundales bacterium]
MIATLLALIAGCGVLLTITFDALLYQPDWGMAILIAAITARRRHWPWVLPMLMLHDMMLYWNPLPWSVVVTVAGLALVVWIDHRVGPALAQRLTLIVLALIPMFWQSWIWQNIILTLLLTFVLWHMIRQGKPLQPRNNKPVCAG